MTTSTTNIESKVKASFISEFGYEPTNIKIDENYADADNYWCKLTSKGVKKGSWRLNQN